MQLAQWRRVQSSEIELIDITVKSGLLAFAPTWPMVLAYKKGQLTDVQYTNIYTELMRQSWLDHQPIWRGVLNKPVVALGCYCSADAFCHRHILCTLLARVADQHHLEFEQKGELR